MFLYPDIEEICLIGNTEVYSRMVGKQEAQFAQLFSRIRMNRYYSTRKVTLGDVKALFPKLAEDGQKKELDFLHGISQSKWGIRGAVNVYNNAVNNEDISMIQTAIENGLDPYHYLTWLLKAAKDADLSQENTIQALLPWNAPAECHAK